MAIPEKSSLFICLFPLLVIQGTSVLLLKPLVNAVFMVGVLALPPNRLTRLFVVVIGDALAERTGFVQVLFANGAGL